MDSIHVSIQLLFPCFLSLQQYLLSQEEVAVSEWLLYPKHEFLIVKAEENLKPDAEYELRVKYHGSLQKGHLNGFYTSRYKSQNKTKYETLHFIFT